MRNLSNLSYPILSLMDKTERAFKRIPYKMPKIRYTSLWKKIKDDVIDEQQKGNKCTIEDIILRILHKHYEKKEPTRIIVLNSFTGEDD